MKLCSLVTENFRNLCGERLEFDDGINVLYGDNAMGKTNTLEAIYLFATGKSFRTRSEKDFISHGQSYARAQIEYTFGGMTKSMCASYLQNGAKVMRGMQLEGVPVERVSEFLGNFRAVLFTPDHLELVKGAPEERRRLVDMALCQIKPRFVKSLNDYTKVLAQRNNYLKSIKFSGKRIDFDYIDVLNRQLSAAGAVVTKQRAMYCEILSDLSGQKYALLSGGSEGLFARYISRVPAEVLKDEEAVCEALYSMYKRDTAHDAELGKTSHGPHHDEIAIYVAKKDEADEFFEAAKRIPEEKLPEYAARSFGSQGQQRSAVLAIKLAEGEIIKEKCGEYPVFLLDDLFSELDEGRKTRLASMFGDKQCIITSCDKSAPADKQNARVISVKNGQYFC